MIGPGTGVRVYLACGHVDMRKGIGGLSAIAQDVLRQRPASGAVFAFRGRISVALVISTEISKIASCLMNAVQAQRLTDLIDDETVWV